MAMSDYLRELRTLVGPRVLLLPHVAALIFDDAGRLLLLRSSEGDFWMLPGGSVEPDEHPEHAVVRETLEETGFEVVVESLHSVHGGPAFHLTYSSGDEASIVMTCYRCRITGGIVDADDEVAELRWVTLEQARLLPTKPWADVVLPRAFEPA
ncbi:MAG: hypothetical protein JWN72_1130 [Thermoleophilia bacterium]|nr:hypothetical protein [Thermoleophilia bacterium]